MDNRPYVTLQINGLIKGLLDSGSAVTIRGNEAHLVLEKHGLPIITEDFITATAAGGQKISGIGFFL